MVSLIPSCFVVVVVLFFQARAVKLSFVDPYRDSLWAESLCMNEKQIIECSL